MRGSRAGVNSGRRKEFASVTLGGALAGIFRITIKRTGDHGGDAAEARAPKCSIAQLPLASNSSFAVVSTNLLPCKTKATCAGFNVYIETLFAFNVKKFTCNEDATDRARIRRARSKRRNSLMRLGGESNAPH
jgi:hypothetical protein